MRERLLTQLDQIRRAGFRPCVIGAIACNGLIGLFANKDYPGWEFPQGGIEVGEIPIEALHREIKEELGWVFSADCNNFQTARIEFLFESSLQMKINGQLITSDGLVVNPCGKHYIVYGLDMRQSHLPEIAFENERFDLEGGSVKFHKYIWTDTPESHRLVNQIQSPRKREIVDRAISGLVRLGFTSL